MDIGPVNNHSDDSAITRREFIFSRPTLYGCIAITGVAGTAALMSFTDFSDRLQRIGLRERIVSEVGQNRRSAVNTLVESVIMWAGNMALCNVMDKREIMHGTHAHDGTLAEEFSENHPIRDYLHTSFTTPVLEEALFRLVPASFFTEENPHKVKLHWDVGLTANVIFSVIHNFGKEDKGKFKFTVDSLPLEQFIMGAYCWYAQRTGGFVHAAGAHILYNNLCALYEPKKDFDNLQESE